ncbi:GlmU family protein [Chondrinema litorale]|uniref:GlmU family protein n=1 Tax=Chondrinema litorale TaxID=2994555 RepID=UPI002542E920|nr:GlmU family protein [Chondrinema litorale]UZR95428.1 GlmU family protein [Chondrinema litorale]
MNIILFDEPGLKSGLLPFTYIRPVAAIRIGILKIYEKWEKHFLGNGYKTKVSYLTDVYLQEKFPAHFDDVNLYINGAVCPEKKLFQQILGLQEGEGLKHGNELIAYKTGVGFDSLETLLQSFYKNGVDFFETDGSTVLRNSWDIFTHNRKEIVADFEVITKNRKSAVITDPFTKVYAPENVFVEEGASIKAAIINAENGPVYIGKNAAIHEGALVRGALALCEDAQINMGAKIRGDNTFGPSCKIGGEVTNSVLFGYSNKGHDGYLGNAVIGEWCNLGADTNSSNLKNNYSTVKVWNYAEEAMVSSGLQFCGLMMGDHSKCGINTMFNTGTSVGVAAIIFGGGFPQKFVSSFTWGGIEKSETFKLDKMYELAENVLVRKGKAFTDIDKKIFEHVFEITSKYRRTFN